MTTRPLLPQQPVTEKGDRGSRELIEIIQRLHEKIVELESRIVALEP